MIDEQSSASGYNYASTAQPSGLAKESMDEEASEDDNGNDYRSEHSGSSSDMTTTNTCAQLTKTKKVKQGCKQIYDKINYCTFCEAEIKSKISRHLLSNSHKDQPSVSRILMMPTKSKERRAELAILENEGNFKHNRKVLVSNEGCLIFKNIEKWEVVSPNRR